MNSKIAAWAACSIALSMAACGGGDDAAQPPAKTTVAVIGDVPYGTSATDTTQSALHLPFLRALDGDADVAMVLHVGDIHSGSQYCTQAYDVAIASDWQTLKHPLIYTPGDNEWADCHKVKQGGGAYNAATGQIDYQVDGSNNLRSYAGGDPLANLDLVRAIFFSKPGRSLGVAMDVHSQALEHDAAFPTDGNYVENVWFEKANVLFVTANIPGGSNNDTDPWYGVPSMSPRQSQEVANRTAATLRWLTAAFKQATQDNAMAVVIQVQADMWDMDGKPASHLTQYKPIVDLIAAQAQAFGKPVLLLNGDSHVYRSDNPLVPGATCLAEPTSGAPAQACTADAYVAQPNGYNVPNFHRLVVHGSTLPLEWLKLTIDPAYDPKAAASATSFGPFAWQRVAPTLAP